MCRVSVCKESVFRGRVRVRGMCTISRRIFCYLHEQKQKNPPPPKARAFQMSVEAATDTNDAITGMFLRNVVQARMLFDSGANRSFMSTIVDMGDSRMVRVTLCVSGATIDIKGSLFLVTFLVMRIPSFDVVLGMDWLSNHKASIKCHKKIISFPLTDGRRKEKKVVSDIPVVSEYSEVCPDDLPFLASIREVEYKTDLVIGATPVAKAPYRLGLSKIHEMMSQIQELLDHGFIRPSSSPWGALVLFVKKKDVAF
ncbi:uncharacterized protein [Rutidosis leptorrhynchoides]|uniref:uncharacterized protein n=1 Tax=Rutidosis leptorrhynchoides TaxID=125765 RepID=UPI003A99FEE4